MKISINIKILLFVSFFSLGCNLRERVSGFNDSSVKDILPDKFISEKDNETMSLIPSGEFIMGSDEGSADEQPKHKVYLDAFYIDVTEVTCKRYERFLNETGYRPHELWNPEFDRPEDPVAGVTWYDAIAFAAWAGKRLPTEAEWEKAARGVLTGMKYPWGNEIDHGKANYKSFGTAPVKSYEPNNYGLYDIIGNVWEWCQDTYDPSYYAFSPGKNPAGPLSGFKKVIRGGCWFSSENTLSVSNRNRHDPFIGSFNIGFRCVKSASELKSSSSKSE